MPNMPEPQLGDSGDYTWRPEYTRRTTCCLDGTQIIVGSQILHSEFTRRTTSGEYGIPTLGDKLAAAQDEIVQLAARVMHLEAIVHKYINAGG